ncbi:MAG: NYN domain-containing protein [Candidatus Paceibacterota bacterium]
MKRYAFVDVQNTASTTEKMLDFVVDWMKVADFLKNKKSCSEVLFYTGIDNGDIETAKEFDLLNKTPCCIVKSKSIFSYKNKDKIIAFKCSGCLKDNIQIINMGYRKKANCDVELAVDVIDKSAPDVELLIFTGDGDFEYVIRKALEKGVTKVTIVSYAGRDIKSGLTVAVYSTKLRALVSEKKDKVFYMSLLDIKENIKKEIPVVSI